MGTKRGTKTRSTSRARSPMTKVSGVIGARYRPGKEQRVREVLSSLGRVDVHPLTRMVVLHQTPRIAKGKIQAALDDLQSQKLIDFVTPVFLDRASKALQVPTDEITVRLKPGRQKQVLTALTAAHGFRVGRRNAYEPSQYVVKVLDPSGTQTLDIARSLDQSDDVEFASPNFLTEVKRSQRPL